MIQLHQSLKRSEDIMKSLQRFFEINMKSIDGVIETFSNKSDQGYLVKIFRSFNHETDLVIWFYESLENKNIQIAYSTRNNCDANNNWIDKNKLNIKYYLIKKDIKKTIIQNIFDTVNKYYHLDEIIEMPDSLKI